MAFAEGPEAGLQAESGRLTFRLDRSTDEIARHRHAVRRERAVLILILERHAQVPVGFGIVGPGLEGFLEFSDCLVQRALPAELNAQVIAGDGRIRLQRDGLVKSTGGAAHPALTYASANSSSISARSVG